MQNVCLVCSPSPPSLGLGPTAVFFAATPLFLKRLSFGLELAARPVLPTQPSPSKGLHIRVN